MNIASCLQWTQRTPEWYDKRNNYLTSSDLAAVLGQDKYKTPNDVLFKKCGISDGFQGNEATRHGEKYEQEAIDIYCKLTGRTSFNVGLIPYSALNKNVIVNGIDCEFLAGSADSVSMLDNETSLSMIEVKCPLYRRIKYGCIPIHYLAQVHMNMHILNLDRADFIEYVPPGFQHSSYPRMNIVRVYKDDDWFLEVLPILRQFWDDVLYYREIGIENHPEFVTKK